MQLVRCGSRPQENINLPASLLSRFDIMWLLLDTADWDRDTALAQHVLHVHRHRRAPALESAALSAEELRQYIAVARQYEPTVPMALTDQVRARLWGYAGVGSADGCLHVTVNVSHPLPWRRRSLRTTRTCARSTTARGGST